MTRPDKRFYEALGKDIRRIRKQKGMGLRQMEELTQISRTTLSHYENGDPNIGDNLDAICKALCIDPDKEWDEIAQQCAEEETFAEEEKMGTDDLYIGDLTSSHQQTIKELIEFLRAKERK